MKIVSSLPVVLLIILSGALLCGCEKNSPGSRVQAYDEALIRVYREQNADLIKPFATENEWRKIVALIDLKKTAHLVLESNLLSFRLLEVTQVSENLARVTTEELWSYHDRPLDPGVEPGIRFKVKMKLLFELTKEGGKYKINKGRTLASHYLEPKNYKSHQNTHGRSRPAKKTVRGPEKPKVSPVIPNVEFGATRSSRDNLK